MYFLIMSSRSRMHSPIAKEVPKLSTPQCLCCLNHIKPFQLKTSQQNINPTRSLSWVLLELCTTNGVFIHKIQGCIFAAASKFSLTQESCFFRPESQEKNPCENSSLYRKGCPSSSPNRIHQGFSNIKLKLLSLEILYNRINWHTERTRIASVHRWQQTLWPPERGTDEDIALYHHWCQIPLGWFCCDVCREPLSWAAPCRAVRAWILGQDLGLVCYSLMCCLLAWG